MTDDARRRRCDPIETCVVDGEARLGMFRRIGDYGGQRRLISGEAMGFGLIGG